MSTGYSRGSVIDAEIDRHAFSDSRDQHGNLHLLADGRFHAFARQIQLDAVRPGHGSPRNGCRPEEARVARIKQCERLGDAAELMATLHSFADDLKDRAGSWLGVLRRSDGQE